MICIFWKLLLAVAIGVILAVIFEYVVNFVRRRRESRGAGISLLMPFGGNDPVRVQAFEWLVRYWAAQLPRAKLIIGRDDNVPFSKTTAFNNARSRARGDILVLLDADCYIDAKVLVHCAREIREARREGKRLWYIPYRHFYRLNREASQRVLASDPADPLVFSSPPSRDDTEDQSSASNGHWWGALIQVMPREAYDIVGGCDTRFAGWGGEDVAFMRAVDTLYAKHKTTPNQVLHLWHPVIRGEWKLRKWPGQLSAQDNEKLANRYYAAFGDPQRMRVLVDEYKEVVSDG